MFRNMLEPFMAGSADRLQRRVIIYQCLLFACLGAGGGLVQALASPDRFSMRMSLFATGIVTIVITILWIYALRALNRRNR